MKVFYEGVTDLEENVKTLFGLLKWEELIKKGDRVLIKPNFCANYEDGVTTSLKLLETVVNLVKQRTKDVFVGETESAFKSFKKLEDNFPLDCEFLNLSKEETYIHKGLNLPKITLESVIINVPVFKTHVLTGMTLGIKNLFGFVQDREKSRYHYKIDSTLLKILEIIRPQINILDGIYSMDRTGPTNGIIKRTDFLMASRDVVALDIAACRIAGVEASQVNHIGGASKKYKIRPEISTEIKLDFDVPKVGRTTKFGAYLQHNTISRKLLENPGVYHFAKSVKNVIDSPKAPKR